MQEACRAPDGRGARSGVQIPSHALTLPATEGLMRADEFAHPLENPPHGARLLDRRDPPRPWDGGLLRLPADSAGPCRLPADALHAGARVSLGHRRPAPPKLLGSARLLSRPE